MRYKFDKCPICGGLLRDNLLFNNNKKSTKRKFDYTCEKACRFTYAKRTNEYIFFILKKYMVESDYAENYTEIANDNGSGRIKIEMAPIWDFSDLDKLYNKIQTLITFQ